MNVAAASMPENPNDCDSQFANWLSLVRRSTVSAESVAFFRVVLGGTLMWWSAHYLLSGRAHWLCSSDFMHLKWPGFGWVPSPGAIGATVLFSVVFVAGVLVCAGAFARAAAGTACAGLTWFLLTDQTNYQNHYYLLLLLTGLAAILPLSRVMALDAEPAADGGLIAFATLLLLRFHLALPYVFGGLSKIDPEWLSARPMQLMLADLTGFAPESTLCFVFSRVLAWGGLVFDLSIVPLLLWSRTRKSAFLLLVLFHLCNALLFPIHVFPWFMIGASTIFLAPDWPRHLLPGRVAVCPATIEPGSFAATAVPPKPPQPGLMLLACGWCLLQLLLPLRHLVIPGDASWTEEGHFFAWRMMLRGKTGEVHFLATRAADGRSWLADQRRLLHAEQKSRFAADPEMIRQTAGMIATIHRQQTGESIEVRALALASLNGREPALLIDPEVDLAAESHFRLHQNWILPKPELSRNWHRQPPGNWVTRSRLPGRWKAALGVNHQPDSASGLANVRTGH